jgi:hypothetical protein
LKKIATFFRLFVGPKSLNVANSGFFFFFVFPTFLAKVLKIFPKANKPCERVAAHFATERNYAQKKLTVRKGGVWGGATGGKTCEPTGA